MVTCPRCHADGILDTAPGCPKCGWTFGDGPAPVPDSAPDEPVSQEIVNALRRELSGQYEITDLLGRGGMSLVYLAQEVELNRQVAIKVLPLQMMTGPAAAERFEREGKIAASLDHPHIVPIFRVGSSGTFLWYTMKRVRGRSLEQIIVERGALPVEETLAIVEQVGSALQYAHRHGVVHRDIKPANVMIEDSGWALVCDFGVARAFGSVSLTQTGASLGTPRYMSPEQFEGQPVDGRCDQYSLAILTYEALTGALPFSGDSLSELIRKHLLEPPPRLSDVRPDIPEHVSDAVMRAMSKKPAERFPDIAAFITALGGKAAARPSPFSTLIPTRRRPAISDAPTVPLVLKGRRSRAVALATTFGILLAAAGLWIALHRSPVDSAAIQSVAPATQAPPPAAPPTAAPPPASPPSHPRVVAAAPARLSLSTQPPGTLFLDDRRIGSTPVIGLEVPAGRHRARVTRDGYTSFDTVFTAEPGREIKMTRKALRQLGP